MRHTRPGLEPRETRGTLPDTSRLLVTFPFESYESTVTQPVPS